MLSKELERCLTNWIGEHTCATYKSGANSRGYILKSSKGNYFLKLYPDDKSSSLRINKEVDFINFVESSGCKLVPKVIAVSLACRCVLFQCLSKF